LRKKFLKEIEKISHEKHRIISDSEDFSLSYTAPFEDVEGISSYLKEDLQKRRSEEIARRQSCVGPHRDDVSYLINGVDAKKFASQGQQRTVVLALKLAELDIIKEKNEEYPILLLDDVLAELDILRQNYLLSSIEDNIQTIITATDTKAFSDEFLSVIDVIKIQAGKMI
jgi:DNA replication and repair protein RecF